VKSFDDRLRQAAAQVCAMSETGELTREAAEFSLRTLFKPEAAAPDLLDACVQFVRVISGGPMALGEAGKIARAAIAKAEVQP
jgi:hypothetical protein